MTEGQWGWWCQMSNGTAIYRERCAVAFTLADLASAVGVSVETIARIEAGQYHGSNDLIERIARVLWEARP